MTNLLNSLPLVDRAYTTGFCLRGHSVAVSEEAFRTLFEVVSCEMGGCSMNIHILGRIYPSLIDWALKGGLRLVRFVHLPQLYLFSFRLLKTECILKLRFSIFFFLGGHC
jgi:hypothetical protein